FKIDGELWYQFLFERPYGILNAGRKTGLKRVVLGVQ
ncbi:MAG: hypothetical protein ACI898_002159, partial [Flavobacteriales bacterium]